MESTITLPHYWYIQQHELACYWSRQTNQTLRQVCAIIAVLSPLQSWPQNLKWAYQILTKMDCKPLGLGRNQEKAYRIKYGERIAHNLRGYKVRNFYLNLVYPHNPRAITIDRRMLRLIGWPKETITSAQYQKIAAIYRQRAHKVGLIPSQYQALLWALSKGEQK